MQPTRITRHPFTGLLPLGTPSLYGVCVCVCVSVCVRERERERECARALQLIFHEKSLTVTNRDPKPRL